MFWAGKKTRKNVVSECIQIHIHILIYIYICISTVYNFISARFIYFATVSHGKSSSHPGLGADAAPHHGRQVGHVGCGVGEPAAGTRSPCLRWEVTVKSPFFLMGGKDQWIPHDAWKKKMPRFKGCMHAYSMLYIYICICMYAYYICRILCYIILYYLTS